jgi:hypothetical protein
VLYDSDSADARVLGGGIIRPQALTPKPAEPRAAVAAS